MWHRPYAVPKEFVRRELAAAGIMIAALGLVIAFAATGRIDDVRAGVAAIVAIAAAGYAARIRIVGVFMNDRGILVRAFDGTLELPWRSVAWIDVLPSDFNTASVGPLMAVWISTVDGKKIETPLIRRRAGLATTSVLSVHLPSADFDQAVRRLRATHAR